MGYFMFDHSVTLCFSLFSSAAFLLRCSLRKTRIYDKIKEQMQS